MDVIKMRSESGAFLFVKKDFYMNASNKTNSIR